MPAQQTTTDMERQKILETYFKNGLDGAIDTLPSKEKRRLIILEHIVERFEQKRTYTEKEVNEMLKPLYADFVLIRRYLIEYKFLGRNKDGSMYWRRENNS